MNRGISPEDLYSKLVELEDNDDEKAISLVQEFIKGTKKRSWSKAMNELMVKAIEIIISQSQIKPLKEVIAFCRSLTQVNYIAQFEGIIKSAKEFLLDKYEISNDKFKKFKDKKNIDIEEDNEMLDDNLMNDNNDLLDEQQFIHEQKFIWEAYKILLDVTKMNSKLFPLYIQILKDCFLFCGENRCIHEFKALCDSIRNYLFMLKKNENKPNFTNKIMISDAKILRLLIQSSLNQIETANKLEEWEESFKTSEKIVSFIEDYESIEKKDKDKKGKEKKYLKIPFFFEIELYNHIQKLLWVSNYPMYHTYAMISIQKTIENNKTKIDSLTEKENQIYQSYNLSKINERIILAYLSTSIKNAYTNFTKVGEELFEDNNDTEIKTCQKMMKILKINHIPSRKYLLGYLLNNNIINKANKEIKELFDIFENEQNPITLAKKGVKYISKIINDEDYKPYLRKIKENLIIKFLMLLPNVYKNISLSRVINLFKELNLDEYEINDIISESSRINLFKCKIDFKNDLIKFITNDSSQDRFNNLIENFLKSSKKVIKDIIWTKNKTKLGLLKDKIYGEVRNINSKSLALTNSLLEESRKQNKKLKAYITKRDKLKGDLKLKTAETKEKTIRLLQDKEQLERDKLRSEQEQREIEAEMKRYLIDSLRTFTNSIVLKDGKRIKLDDLLKDLNKVTPEELIKHFDEQKIESASKKEKELKKDTKRKDYVLREFRKRDMEKYEQELKKEDELLEKKRQEEIKKELLIRDEVLKYKPYKDSYCAEIEKKNLENYKKEVDEYNKYLKEKVTQDIYNELDAFFTEYLDDFTKKQMAENQQKKALDTWTPFDTSRKVLDTLTKGSQFTNTKIEKSPNKEIIRGLKADDTKEFARSSRAEENKEVDKLKQKENEEKTVRNKENKKDDKLAWRKGPQEQKERKKSWKKDEGDWKDKKDDKKKYDKKDEENWRNKKEDKKNQDKKDDKKTPENKKEEEDWRNKKDDKKKHENKKEDDWRKGGNDHKKDDKDKHENKKEDQVWRRGGDEPKKDDRKKHETKKDENNWRRGGDETKKEEKKETKKDDGNWKRGDGNWRRGGNEPKKEEKKETKKDEGTWRRGGDEPKKDEKKETKKDEGTWRRGGDEPKKDEKKTEDKKTESKKEDTKKKKKKK